MFLSSLSCCLPHVWYEYYCFITVSHPLACGQCCIIAFLANNFLFGKMANMIDMIFFYQPQRFRLSVRLLVSTLTGEPFDL